MKTKRQRILEEIGTRLASVQMAGGRVYRGRQTFLPSDRYPLISVIPQDAVVEETSGDKERITLPINVVAALLVDPENPGDDVEAMLGEIKVALASDNGTWQGFGLDRGTVRHIGETGYSHDDDYSYITSSVQFDVEYIEIMGDPYT